MARNNNSIVSTTNVEQCTWDIRVNGCCFLGDFFLLLLSRFSTLIFLPSEFFGEKSFRNKRKHCREKEKRFVTNELPLKITSQYTLIKSESISNGREIYVLCFSWFSDLFCNIPVLGMGRRENYVEMSVNTYSSIHTVTLLHSTSGLKSLKSTSIQTDRLGYCAILL